MDRTTDQTPVKLVGQEIDAVFVFVRAEDHVDWDYRDIKALGQLGGDVRSTVGDYLDGHFTLLYTSLPLSADCPTLSPNPPKDTDGRREESGRVVRELQGK